MIASIEQAIKQRLSDGLGQMVSGVHTYGGEFDGEGLAQVVNQFPAVWIMFAGITNSEPHDTRRTRYQVTGRFTVLVGDRASGSEADSRFGSLHQNDVGTYRLMQTVRLLLINQTMGLCIGRLKPGKAKSLFQNKWSWTQSAYSRWILKRIGLKTHCKTAIGRGLRFQTADRRKYMPTYPPTEAVPTRNIPTLKVQTLSCVSRLKNQTNPPIWRPPLKPR